MFSRIINKKNLSIKIALTSIAILAVFFFANSAIAATSQATEVSWTTFFRPDALIQFILGLYLAITSFILSIAGYALNMAIDFSLRISTIINGMSGIGQAWVVIRDVISMFFIFLLLFTSIKVIIGKAKMSQVGELIIGIIIAGFFINFSFVIVKLIIDATNMFALGIYNAIIPANSTFSGGLSDVLMNLTKMNGDALKSSGGWSAAKILSTGFQQYTLAIFNGSIQLITAVLFFAGAALFMIRTLVLIGMLAASPVLAFNFINLEFLGDLTKEGRSLWNKFINAALFAPMFMLLLYVGLAILVGSGTDSALSKQLALITGKSSGSEFEKVIRELVSTIVTYAIVMGFYMAALKKGTSLGEWGGDRIIKMAESGKERFSMGNNARFVNRSLGTLASETGQAAGQKFATRLENSAGGTGIMADLAKTRFGKAATDKKSFTNALLTKGASRAVNQTISGKIDSATKYNGAFAETVRPIADSLKKSYEQKGIYKDSKSEAELEKNIKNDRERAENINAAKETAKDFLAAYQTAENNGIQSEMDKLSKGLSDRIGALSEKERSEIKLSDVKDNPTLAAIIGKKYFNNKEKDEKTDYKDFVAAQEARIKGIAEGLSGVSGKPHKEIVDNFKALEGEELRDLLFTNDSNGKPYYKEAKIAKLLDTNSLKKLEQAIGGTEQAKDIGTQLAAFEAGNPPVPIPGYQYVSDPKNKANWGI